MSSMYLNICREDVKRMESGSFSVVPCDRKTGNGYKLKHQKTLFPYEDDLAHIPWRGGRVSILGDLQKPCLGDST